MNKYGRILYTTKVDNMKSMGDEVNVGVYGIFTTSNSGNGNWKYYLISYKKQPNSNFRLTSEWHSYSMEGSYDSIEKHAKEISSVDDGKKICDEFKMKWITGSNDTIQHIRDEKLNEILDNS
jgi:hypothetical protein